MLFAGGGKILRHCASQFLDGLPDLAANFIMCLIRGRFSLDIFSAEFFISLRGAEKVCSQLCATHVVKYLLVFLQPFSGVDLLHTQSSVQALVAFVLEDRIISRIGYARQLCGFCQ